MQWFNSGFFWFIEGILFCLVILGLRAWARDNGVPMPPWKWVVFIAWLMFFGFTIAFIGTSLGEGEPDAAKRGGILFSALVVISGFALWRLLKIGSNRRETT